MIKNSLNTYSQSRTQQGVHYMLAMLVCIYVHQGHQVAKFTNGHSGPGQAPFYEHTTVLEAMNTITDVG